MHVLYKFYLNVEQGLHIKVLPNLLPGNVIYRSYSAAKRRNTDSWHADCSSMELKSTGEFLLC